MSENPWVDVPRIPVGDGIEAGFDWLTANLSVVFDTLDTAIDFAVSGLTGLLVAPPDLLTAALFALFAALIRGWKVGVAALAGLVFILGMRQWEPAMETLSLVVVATAIALVIAIPVGVLAARNDRVSSAVRPVLDLMQTMPAFVWLVPVVFLFSLGPVSGVVATVIFALPPGVRLTELGIRQVDAEIVEAGHAFGSTPGQILRRIQLPLATPTIMAGVNQVIMLALSMAVIAGLVGAGGLGGQVTASIARLDIGLGFEAGLAVVVLAIYLDRVTASVGGGGSGRVRRSWQRWRGRGASARSVEAETEVQRANSRRGFAA